MTGTVALTVSLIVACSGENPAAPGKSDGGGTGGDGTVTASCPGCFPVPGPVPGGNPVPNPVPGAPGAPTGGPTPNPSASPSPGSSPTPTPIPTPTPTPTPTPAPTTCPFATYTYTAPPAVLVTGGTGSATATFAPADATVLNDSCRITGLNRVTMHLTAPGGVATVFGGASPAVALKLGAASQSLMSTSYRPTSLTGNQMGTACTSIAGFSFQGSGSDLAAATSPYAGLFSPTSAATAFVSGVSTSADADVSFVVAFAGVGGDVTVECLQVVAILANK